MSELLHTAFGLICHQEEARSPEVAGTILLCYRCLGTFAGLLGAAITVSGHAWWTASSHGLNSRTTSAQDAYPLSVRDGWILGLSFMPLAIDGAANALGIWNSPWSVRLATGLLLGSALATVLHVARRSSLPARPRSLHVQSIFAGVASAGLFLAHNAFAQAVGIVMLVAGVLHLMVAARLIASGLQEPLVHSSYRIVDPE